MKNTTLHIIITFFLLLIFQVSSAQNFEGVIQLSMNDFIKGEKSEIVWKAKGERNVLIYSGNQKGTDYQYRLIVNTNDTRAKILTEVNGQKVAYDAKLPDSEEKTQYIKHTFTGKTKIISGYEAEEMILTAADRTTVCY